MQIYVYNFSIERSLFKWNSDKKEVYFPNKMKT